MGLDETGILYEVPHVEAPAGAHDLARAAPCHVLPGVTRLRIVFVPGVRTGGSHAVTRETVAESDVMRGEEVVALGLVRRGPLAGGGVLLSLGSHWKAVHVDAEGRVARSVSTPSGELIESARWHTILASSLPGEWQRGPSGRWSRSATRAPLARQSGRGSRRPAGAVLFWAP